MRLCGLILATAALGVAAVASTPTQAQTLGQAARARAPAVSLSEAAASRDVSAAGGRRALRWNESGRWGLNFNLNEPVGREADWGDVEAGAYYRLSPSLRVGAAAGLAEPEPDPARAAQTEGRAQPRVRLETIFKF